MSFAHGANDVANAMGPLSAVYTIWSTGNVSKNSPVDTWILVLGEQDYAWLRSRRAAYIEQELSARI